ncbi:MAG: valine--tRNA ligase [Bacteroidetes bacterium]|nr:MAG: valine--tRNA ligase [Bacteroidota bacterium]
MKELPKQYTPKQTEEKWYKHWMEKGYFKSSPDEREAYCITIPPPNVTGVLHMGHMLNNTLQDVLVRRARMQGKNACWVPGTDHASIATEAKVVNKLKEEGIDKNTLSREQFLEHAWEWKEKHGGIILEQLKKLGASCDWDRTAFTMDETLSSSVIKTFVDLYNKGLIYRGVRMVNWDPKALTALSDEEVIHKEVQSKFYYLRYLIEGTEDEYVTIATTRPETILGDTAICVHPEDERFQHLKGRKALVPLINRPIPFIFDEYVDREFGTGALKVTPAHDINDYNLGIKHNLPTIDIFNDNGTLNEKAEIYIGEDRFVVRKKISKELEAKGHLVKLEEITNNIGYSERTDEVIEPKLSLQWFMKMEEMAKPALDVVMDDTIKFYPPRMKNIYRHWMENVRDWCISRQLWWGHRIPAWYLPTGEVVVAETAPEALLVARDKYNSTLSVEELTQDEDVLDTWFSSWLWPISVFDGINNPDNEDIKYYYPTNDMVTAPEILFFWVARMIMAGLEYRKEIPFKNVYLHGIVRDKQGRKMSKSLGNSPDPLDLIDQYGADGVRVGMLFSSPAGNDLLFDEGLCEQGRNFCNKIWNAFRLTQGWEIDENLAQPHSSKVAVEWFESSFNKALAQIEDHFSKYRMTDALMAVYKLIWDDFCSWYLEMIKPAYLQPIDRKSYDQTISLFNKLLKVLHPFMPFISEEIYQHIRNEDEPESIMIAMTPLPQSIDEALLARFDFASQAVMAIRNLRQEKGIAQKISIDLLIRKNNDDAPDTTFDDLVSKLCNLGKIEYVAEKPLDAFNFIIKTTEFFVPVTQDIDVEAEVAKIKQEIQYQNGFLTAVMKKLGNERFVNNAPDQVVAIEKKKQADAESKIKVLEEQLKSLEGKL